MKGLKVKRGDMCWSEKWPDSHGLKRQIVSSVVGEHVSSSRRQGLAQDYFEHDHYW